MLKLTVLAGVAIAAVVIGALLAQNQYDELRAADIPPAVSDEESVGVASFYDDAYAGRVTASGERYDPAAETCAHPNLPMGTVLRIRNLDNGREATCRVNDRGPFVSGRILDVSRVVAERLGMYQAGIANVSIREEPR